MHNCSQSCSRYVERLPLMFIFGIATSPSTIQHMLPHSVSSLLCIELFQSLTCTQHLATVIDKVAAQPTHDFRVSNLRFFLLNVDFSSCLPLFSPVQLILTSHFPFKLNKKVMQVLMSIFLYHDFSVRNFIKGVQVRESLPTVRSVALNRPPTLCCCHSWRCWSTSTRSPSACSAAGRTRRCST